MRGWLSTSHVSYPTNRQIFTYVNGRFVRDKLEYGIVFRVHRQQTRAMAFDLGQEDLARRVGRTTRAAGLASMRGDVSAFDRRPALGGLVGADPTPP